MGKPKQKSNWKMFNLHWKNSRFLKRYLCQPKLGDLVYQSLDGDSFLRSPAAQKTIVLPGPAQKFHAFFNSHSYETGTTLARNSDARSKWMKFSSSRLDHHADKSGPSGYCATFAATQLSMFMAAHNYEHPRRTLIQDDTSTSHAWHLQDLHDLHAESATPAARKENNTSNVLRLSRTTMFRTPKCPGCPTPTTENRLKRAEKTETFGRDKPPAVPNACASLRSRNAADGAPWSNRGLVHTVWWIFLNWWFPKLGVPLVIIYFHGTFPIKKHPAMGVPPWLWKPSTTSWVPSFEASISRHMRLLSPVLLMLNPSPFVDTDNSGMSKCMSILNPKNSWTSIILHKLAA